jgi:2-hydroxychromene-2-carboxylate isomerase
MPASSVQQKQRVTDKELPIVTKAKWYFDFISPFAYLQLARFSQLPADLEITPVPVVFGGLLKHWGQLGPAEIPPKRRFIYRFFQWNADTLGVPFEMPPQHPYNPLASLRLCIAAGSTIDNVRAIFDVIYGQGTQPDSPAGIQAMAQVVGVSDPHTAMADMTVKETLRTNTAAAIADGVFGVPTFVIEGEVFWGDDATEMMLDYLANAALFKTAEMQRISNMPMGLTRPK